MQLLFVAAVAALAYAPSLNIPLIADDYPNVSQALTYGAPGGIGTLLHDAQFRLRATSYWAMYALWQVAGLNPVVYHAASLLPSPMPGCCSSLPLPCRVCALPPSGQRPFCGARRPPGCRVVLHDQRAVDVLLRPGIALVPGAPKNPAGMAENCRRGAVRISPAF